TIRFYNNSTINILLAKFDHITFYYSCGETFWKIIL
ncbi:hypothetical protein KSS87_003926, partial [Heliosperma pusillum]